MINGSVIRATSDERSKVCKNNKQFFAILITFLMILSLFSAAFAEGETRVPTKTSGDTLEKGDLCVDLASVKDTYIGMAICQPLCDCVHPKDANRNAGGDPEGTFNNYSVAACEKLAGLHPALWEAALPESYEADPRWGIDGSCTIRRAWSVLFDKVPETHPELVKYLSA